MTTDKEPAAGEAATDQRGWRDIAVTLEESRNLFKAEAERLTKERDAALAEVERLKGELDSALAGVDQLKYGQ